MLHDAMLISLAAFGCQLRVSAPPTGVQTVGLKLLVFGPACIGLVAWFLRDALSALLCRMLLNLHVTFMALPLSGVHILVDCVSTMSKSFRAGGHCQGCLVSGSACALGSELVVE